MTRQTCLTTTALLCTVAAGACSRVPVTGPPVLKAGRDQCAECGMLISEERFATALLLDEAGRRSYALFDDIGCMLDAERGKLADAAILERYVHDYASGTWISADNAHILMTSPTAVHAPMGTGMVPFVRHADARDAQARHGGDVLDYRALAAARKAWMQARYGTPGQ